MFFMVGRITFRNLGIIGQSEETVDLPLKEYLSTQCQGDVGKEKKTPDP